MGLKVLITGGTGLLGKALLESAPGDIEIAATFLNSLPPGSCIQQSARMDVRDLAMVQQAFDKIRPGVVIHTGSMGSVDYAQQHPAESWAVNVGGTYHVIDACRRHGAKLVFISSNAVFDGENPPYSEEDSTRPINYYGKLKVEGEKAVAYSGIRHLIVRAILMYGWPHPGKRLNPVAWWVQSLEQRKPIQVVDDVSSMPLLAEACAAACWALVSNDKTGIYHVAGRDRLTLYEFAQETARVFHLDDRLISPVPSAYFSDIAPRPKDTSFLTDKIERELGLRPVGVWEGLSRMKEHRPIHVGASV